MRGHSDAVRRYTFGRVEKEEDKLRDYLPAQTVDCLYENVNEPIHPFADPFMLRLAIKYESRRYDNRWGFKWDKGKLIER